MRKLVVRVCAVVAAVAGVFASALPASAKPQVPPNPVCNWIPWAECDDQIPPRQIR